MPPMCSELADLISWREGRAWRADTQLGVFDLPITELAKMTATIILATSNVSVRYRIDGVLIADRGAVREKLKLASGAVLQSEVIRCVGKRLSRDDVIMGE
jgi:hypothetical protein